MRTLCALPARSSLSIPYIDIAQSRSDRRAQLLKQYHFNCNCVRCKVPLSGEEAALEAFLCPSVDCDGLVPTISNLGGHQLVNSDYAPHGALSNLILNYFLTAISSACFDKDSPLSEAVSPPTIDAIDIIKLRCLKCSKIPSLSVQASWAKLQSECKETLAVFDRWHAADGTKMFFFLPIGVCVCLCVY